MWLRMVLEKSWKNSSSAPAATSSDMASVMVLCSSWRPTCRYSTGCRHSHTSGGPASASTVAGSRQLSRSCVSCTSVCKAFTSIVLSITMPYDSMK